MNGYGELSLVTKAYLDSFYKILNTMISEMRSAPITNSISDIFIRQMIPHHAAAIEMSKNILLYTTNLELQNIALNIIAEQTKSIANMQVIHQQCSLMTNTNYEIAQYMNAFKEISETMFYEMGTAPITNGVNANFVREMIPHHEGAIRMSNNVLQFNSCSPLKPILYAIIATQMKGIKQMHQLLERMDSC